MLVALPTRSAMDDSKENSRDSHSATFQRLSTMIGRFFSDSPNRAKPASSKKTVTDLLSHECTTEQGQHGRLSVHIHSFTIYRAPETLVLRGSQASPSRSARSAS